MLTWQLHNLNGVFRFPENFQAHARMQYPMHCWYRGIYVNSHIYMLLLQCKNCIHDRHLYAKFPNLLALSHVIARKTLLCWHTPVAPSIRRFDEQNGLL